MNARAAVEGARCAMVDVGKKVDIWLSLTLADTNGRMLTGLHLTDFVRTKVVENRIVPDEDVEATTQKIAMGALIALGVLLILKALKLVNTDKKFNGLTLTGLIGDAAYLILYMIFRTVSESEGGFSVKMSVGIHFFVWIHIVVFALAYATNYLNLNALIAGKAENTAE